MISSGTAEMKQSYPSKRQWDTKDNTNYPDEQQWDFWEDTKLIKWMLMKYLRRC